MELKELRKLKWFTQSKVAKKVGVSLQTYQKWENGTSKPNAENQNKLNEVLNK